MHFGIKTNFNIIQILFQASKDTLDIQLNMARYKFFHIILLNLVQIYMNLFMVFKFLFRHQLDAEIKKRLKAEQNVDHMVRFDNLFKKK